MNCPDGELNPGLPGERWAIYHRAMKYVEKWIGILHNLKSLYLCWSFLAVSYFCQIWLAKVKGIEQDRSKKWMELYMIWRAFAFAGLFWQFFYYLCQIWLAKVKGVEQDQQRIKWISTCFEDIFSYSFKFGWKRLQKWNKTNKRTWFFTKISLLYFPKNLFILYSQLHNLSDFPQMSLGKNHKWNFVLEANCSFGNQTIYD